MSNFKPISSLTMKIDYLEGVFDAEALKDIQTDLQKAEICLDARPHHPRSIAGIEELFPQVSIVLSSPDIFQQIFVGIISSVMYDAIKNSLFRIWQKLKLSKITKIQNGKITENTTPVAHFTIGQSHAILPFDIDDEKFKYFVDKFFETTNVGAVTEELYFYYNKETNGIITYTKDQIAQKSYLEWLAQQKEDAEG